MMDLDGLTRVNGLVALLSRIRREANGGETPETVEMVEQLEALIREAGVEPGPTVWPTPSAA